MKQATLDAMKAFAEGKRLIVVENGSPIASPIEHKSVGFGGKISFSDLCEYQICTTMQVNGREYPCPLSEESETGQRFWPVPTLESVYLHEPAVGYVESGFKSENSARLLKAGLLHSTWEAADAHARALFGYPDRPEPTPEEVTAHDMAAIQKQEEIEQIKAVAEAFEDKHFPPPQL